jgi:peptidoglycan/LPS O-acetylase OafA/YrhL
MDTGRIAKRKLEESSLSVQGESADQSSHVEHAAAPAPSKRFTFIDAWRGIAALWVALYHFYGGVSHDYHLHIFVQPLHYLLSKGNAGVEIFFVISGYVIAYSIRQKRITPGYFGRFMLRRSIRLEPPYWATVAAAVGVLWLSNHLRPDHFVALPGWPRILAHLFYLQGFFHVENIVGVFWTLCIEVQFYIFFLALVACSQLLGDRRISRLAALLPLTLASLAIQAHLLQGSGPWMFKFWYLFQLGVLAYWAVSKQVREIDFAIYALLVLAILCWHPFFLGFIGWTTGVGFYLAGRFGRMGTLDYAPLQFLGRRSYSFYLIHFVIGMPFVTFFPEIFFGRVLPTGVAIASMAIALAASLVAATLLYHFIERPCINFGRTIKQSAPKRNPIPHPTQIAVAAISPSPLHPTNPSLIESPVSQQVDGRIILGELQ